MSLLSALAFFQELLMGTFLVLLFGAPIFFSWRWLLKYFIKTPKTRIIATWIATIVSAPILYTGFVIAFFFFTNYYPTREFDQQKWLSENDKRYEQSQHLIESKLLIGKTKAEVRQLLGEEDLNSRHDVLFYSMGKKPGLTRIDPETLQIDFLDDKVVNVRQ